MALLIPPALQRLVSREGDLLLASKPSGISTHRAEPGGAGFAEFLSEQLGAELKVCHRLDKETSGAMVFALGETAAAALGRLFEGREVEKQYLFVTDRPPGPRETIEHKSFIRKYRGRFVSWTSGREPNAETRFELDRRAGRFFVWRAFPASGKPHQIRLHAHDLGIPILGDRTHGGSRFSRVMLHAARVQFRWEQGEISHVAAASRLFDEPALCDNADASARVLAEERAALPAALLAQLEGTQQK